MAVVSEFDKQAAYRDGYNDGYLRDCLTLEWFYPSEDELRPERAKALRREYIRGFGDGKAKAATLRGGVGSC